MVTTSTVRTVGRRRLPGRGVRTDVQCLHRWQKVLRPGLAKGPWTEEEDRIVREMVMKHGVGNIKWSVIASNVGRLIWPLKVFPSRQKPSMLEK